MEGSGSDLGWQGVVCAQSEETGKCPLPNRVKCINYINQQIKWTFKRDDSGHQVTAMSIPFSPLFPNPKSYPWLLWKFQARSPARACLTSTCLQMALPLPAFLDSPKDAPTTQLPHSLWGSCQRRLFHSLLSVSPCNDLTCGNGHTFSSSQLSHPLLLLPTNPQLWGTSQKILSTAALHCCCHVRILYILLVSWRFSSWLTITPSKISLSYIRSNLNVHVDDLSTTPLASSFCMNESFPQWFWCSPPSSPISMGIPWLRSSPVRAGASRVAQC